MGRYARFILPLALGMLVLVETALADQDIVFSQEAEALFQRALSRYRKGHFRRARLEFQDILERFPKNQRSSAAQLMLGKTLYKLEEYDRAISVAERLRMDFPSSRYLPDADFLIGDCYFRQRRYLQAASQYAEVIKAPADPRLKVKALERLGAMASNLLSESEVEELKRRFGSRWIEEAVGIGQARWLFSWGYHQLAGERARALLRRFPEGEFTAEARALLEEIKPQPPRIREVGGVALKRIGVICPLSGEDKHFGEDLRDGVGLALEHLSAEGIDLIFEDSRSDPVIAIKVAQRLIEREDVLCLIGPVRSSATVGVAALANSEGVPIIAPTASEDAVASIGPYVFQINPTPEMEGRRLAEYAIQSLNLQTFAILASSDSYGRKISGSFISKVSQLGGQVISQEWYFPPTTDFREQLERMRRAGLELIQPDSLASEFDREAAEIEPVTTIDGVLIAASSDKVVLIAPQLVFHRIETQVLGGSGWNSLDVIRMGGDYVQGAVFVSGYFEDEGSPLLRKFTDGFRARFERDPGVVAAFGYDAASMAIEEFHRGNTTRESFRDALEKTQDFLGVTGRVSFVEGERVNSSVYVLRIEDGQIVPIKGPRD